MTTLIKVPFLTGVRRLLYLITPEESSFKAINEVPDYVSEAIPFFLGFALLEIMVSKLKGGSILRFNDSFSSLSAGIMNQIPLLFARSIEISTYIYVWNRYHVIELPWDNTWTWILCFLGVDFGYYWFHRAAHEVNILWAAHQVHHSSEDYNLTTALRQPVLQKYFSWGFYLPMALAIPPSVFLVHVQFNLLYQFWIHTEVVKTIGPLEYILNTPSHHRVHHGRNRYCIDKNYGGTLIIFDRMFGTFAQEDEEVVYGLTHPINTWNPWLIQLCHLQHIWERLMVVPGLGNKLSVLFKGPGWDIGKPRLGNPTDIPDVHAPIKKYNAHSTILVDAYVVLHFILILILFSEISINKKNFDEVTIILAVLFILISLTSFGGLFESRPWAPFMEILRCGAALFRVSQVLYNSGYKSTAGMPMLLIGLQILLSLSVAAWIVALFRWLVAVIWKEAVATKTD